MQYCDMTLGLK